MGPELALALMAGGTAASMVGQNEQSRQQRNILNRAADRAEEDQRKGAAQAIGEAQTMQADTRGQAMEAEQQAAFERAQADMAGGAMDDTPANGGSAAYLQMKGERDGAEGDRLTAVARELSKLRGVDSTQQAEATRRGSLAERLGSMWSSGRQRSQAAGLDAQSVDMPLYGQLGQVAQMAGGAGLMGGAGLGATASAAPAMAEMSAAGSAMAAAPSPSFWSSPGIWGLQARNRPRANSMFGGG